MSALGNRYSCIKCAAKFYDLGRSEAICPACGTDQASPEETASGDTSSAKKHKTAAMKE